MDKEQQVLDEAYANLPNEHCTILQDRVFGRPSLEWELTNEMRWLDESFVQIRLILQQKYMSNTGAIKWVDVPVVKDER